MVKIGSTKLVELAGFGSAVFRNLLGLGAPKIHHAENHEFCVCVYVHLEYGMRDQQTETMILAIWDRESGR